MIPPDCGGRWWRKWPRITRRLELSHMLVDNCAMQLVMNPG
ncbi:MAG: hypothetical protein ACLTBV_00085 [Enterocloster bolteae]